MQLESLYSDLDIYADLFYNQIADLRSSVKDLLFQKNFSPLLTKQEQIEILARYEKSYSDLKIAEKQIKEIGDRMRFQNPIIWLLYKRNAYKNNESKPLRKKVNGDKEINNWGDLLDHCSDAVDGTCAKRFDFIQKYYQQKTGKTLRMQFDLGQDLENLEIVKVFEGFSKDPVFMVDWYKHENNTIENEDGDVRKWGIYKQ
jgi:hypothetical protein